MKKKGREREITNRRESVRIAKKRKGRRNREDTERSKGKWEPFAAPQFPLKGVSRAWS